jgi:putative peptide zinc metalloprotease protein
MSRQPQLRQDLSVVEQHYHGGVRYVLKDPIHHAYFTLSALEWELAKLMDGNRTIVQLADEFAARHPDVPVDSGEVESFVARARQLHLLEKSLEEWNVMLLEKRRNERKNAIFQQKGSLLFKRVPLINPQRFIAWLAPRLAVLFEPWAIRLMLLTIAAAALLLIANWLPAVDTVRAIAEWQLASPLAWVFLWLTVLLMIVLHEFGHAVTCAVHGGDVREMGVLFLFFQPCLYANVNDAWTFPDWRKRLYVVAAGVFTEFLIAAFAIFLWWITAPESVIHLLAFQAAAVCALGSVLFNLNPLMKLDGYYALSDWLDIANLRQRAAGYTKERVHAFFGLEYPSVEGTRREKRVFLIYGVLLTIYMALVLTALSSLAFYLLSGWFGWWGTGAAAILAWKLLGRHVRGILSFGWKVLRVRSRKAEVMQSPWVRRVAFACAVALVIYVFFADADVWVGADARTEPRAVAVVHTRVDGILQSTVGSQPGSLRTPVAEGALLAKLVNPELEARFAVTQLDLEALDLDIAEASHAGDARVYDALLMRRKFLSSELARLQADIALLDVRAPIDGIASDFGAAERVESYLAAGTPLFRVLDPAALIVNADVHENDIASVVEGAPVVVTLDAQPDAKLTGVVERIEPSSETSRSHRLYRVRIRLDSVPPWLLPGLGGSVEIRVGRLPVSEKLWRWVTSWLRQDIL